jgi:hypothetical protein
MIIEIFLDYNMEFLFVLNRRCGSGRFLAGSGSDFQRLQNSDPVPDPNPDPDLNKFSAKFFPKILLLEICSEKYSHAGDQKVKKHRFLKY